MVFKKYLPNKKSVKRLKSARAKYKLGERVLFIKQNQFVYNPSYVNFFKNLKAEFIDEFLSLCLVESLQQLFNFFPSKFQFKNYVFLTWYSAGCVWEITYEDVRNF